jgi:uncharacterized protein (TIGR00369 family)
MGETPDRDRKVGPKADTIAAINRAFGEGVPHNHALGLTLVDYDDAGMALMRLPWNAALVGNPETQVLHGGVITSLVDATCGAAIFMGMRPPRPIATLDLRIDYLGPAQPSEAVLCRAQCTKVTRHVAFVRAIAYHADEDDPIATAAGTFMIFGGDKSGLMRGTKTARSKPDKGTSA